MISALTALCHNATGAILCRFFLGCVEASFFPGSIYFLSRWYNRKEMQLRVTILNLGNLAAQGFGGLIAAGILADMEGASGVRAWRWLFIIEGVITVFLGISALSLLPDYPKSTPWLSEVSTLGLVKLALQTRLSQWPRDRANLLSLAADALR